MICLMKSIIFDGRLCISDVRVYFYLALDETAKKQSNKQISKAIGYSSSKVQKSLTTLQELGYLDIVKEPERIVNINLGPEDLEVGEDENPEEQETKEKIGKLAAGVGKLAYGPKVSYLIDNIYNNIILKNNIIINCFFKKQLFPYGNNYFPKKSNKPSGPFCSTNGSENFNRNDLKSNEIYNRNTVKVNVENVKIPSTVQQITDFWNNSNLKRFWYRNTKTFENTIKMIKRTMKGTLFNSDPVFQDVHYQNFTVQDICCSIGNFALAVNNENFQPLPGTDYQDYLSKITLGNFLYNSYGTSKKAKSYFLYFLYTEPEPVRVQLDIQPEDPRVVRIYKKFYKNEILKNVGMGGAFSKTDLRHFVVGANKTVFFWNQNKSNLIMPEKSVTGLARIVTDCIVKSWWKNIADIEPNLFSADITYQRWLPKYLLKNGLIDTDADQDGSIFSI